MAGKIFEFEKSLKEIKKPKFKAFSKNLVQWYEENKASHPWRVFWQKHKDPYHVWVSEIMLQQTVLKVVTPLYVAFIKKYPRIKDLAEASEEEIRLSVRGLGYYSRFDRLHKAAKLLCEEGKTFAWPSSYKEWKNLPGVGEYTASAVSSIAFGEVKAVVDGNVERVLSRVLEIYEPINAPKMKKNLQELSEYLISKEKPGDYNQALMELGQTFCSKSDPECPKCPVKKLCKAYKSDVQGSLPLVLKKEKRVDLDLYALVVMKEDKIFLSKREVISPFLKNRPGFPLLKTLKKKPKKKDLAGVFKHSITHHNIKMHVLFAEEEILDKKDKGLWVGSNTLKENLITSLDLKTFNLLKKHQEFSL